MDIVTPALAAARKAASLLRAKKRAEELLLVEIEIAEALKNGDHLLAAAHRIIYNSLVKGV